MSGGKRKGGIAHIIAVNMGYGHERPAHALHKFASGKEVIIANHYPGIPKNDRELWTSNRTWYERISRFKRIPVVGKAVFGIMDELQQIPDFYPKRDLSGPSLQFVHNPSHPLIHQKPAAGLLPQKRKFAQDQVPTFHPYLENALI
jgi:hypothetical protein